MSGLQTSKHKVTIQVAERQIKFLENRAKELGLSSKADLIKWYIVSDMAKTTVDKSKQDNVEKKRISLEGIISDGRVTDEDIKEVEKEWEIPELQ